MARRNYDAEAIHEECIIHPGLVTKVTGEDAFMIDMRVIGTVRINGTVYTHNDVWTFKCTPDKQGE